MDNPFTTWQNHLLEVRKQITGAEPGCRVEIKEVVSRADHVKVAAQVVRKDGTPTSLCHGYVQVETGALDELFRAEIVALTFCAAELGLEIRFSGSPVAPPKVEIERGAVLTRWNRQAVERMTTTDEVLATMQRLKLPEYDDVVLWMRERKRERKRTHPRHIADKLFPKGGTKVVSTPVEPEPEPFRAARSVTSRTPDQSQSLLERLTEAGISDADIKARTAGKYTSRIQFCVGATEDEIKAVLENASV